MDPRPCTARRHTPRRSRARRAAPEAGSSLVEYVGLGALSAMLVTGIATAIDSAAGDRLAAVVIRRLLAAVSGDG